MSSFLVILILDKFQGLVKNFAVLKKKKKSFKSVAFARLAMGSQFYGSCSGN